MSTYHLIRLFNIDGEKYDFIFNDAELAKRRFKERYLDLAEREAATTSFIIVHRSETSVRCEAFYGERTLGVGWRAELHLNLGFEI